MIYSPLINRILLFIFKAHEGQTDKAGLPYVFHPLHVAESMTDENSTILALIHDIVEDTKYTFKDLENLGVSQTVLVALKLLTRDKNISYEKYIENISTNRLATVVKLSDLKHNSDITRINNISEVEKELVDRYTRAIEFLNNKIKGRTD